MHALPSRGVDQFFGWGGGGGGGWGGGKSKEIKKIKNQSALRTVVI